MRKRILIYTNFSGIVLRNYVSGLMLFFAIILQIAPLQSLANGTIQSKLLTINLKDVLLKDALLEIEKQSEFYFMYNTTHINVNQVVSIKAKNSPLTDVLDKLLIEKGIEYEIVNRQIVTIHYVRIKNSRLSRYGTSTLQHCRKC